MKKSFTLSFLLLSVYSFAQDSSFQLKDYKYRTPGYKALAVDFRFSGNSTKSKNVFNEDSRSRYLNLGPASVFYTRVISTETRLHQSTLELRPAAYFSGNSQNGKETRYSSLNPSFSWFRNDRLYRTNTWFFELGNQLSTAYTLQNVRDTLNRDKNSNINVQDNLILGIGKGRVENVQDAQMALYLLQDLSAQNLLSRTPTADEARLLAQLITDINTKRVFDFRRRQIYELTRLDSFFRSSGLAPQTDIRHFTTINDNWALALNPRRLSGASWYLRLQPGVEYKRFATNNFTSIAYSSKIANTFLNLTPVIGYENYRPISLKWQRNFNVSLAYTATRFNQNTEGTYQGNTTKTSNTTNKWNGTINASYGIGYYPNNRTMIDGSFAVTGNYYGSRNFDLQPLLRFNAQYFISYRTYLRASASVRYNYMDLYPGPAFTPPSDFSSEFSVSVSHIIF